MDRVSPERVLVVVTNVTNRWGELLVLPDGMWQEHFFTDEPFGSLQTWCARQGVSCVEYRL